MFPSKSSLELKNHYYSSISKTIRHILNKKKYSNITHNNLHLLETFKEKIQSFYSLKIIQSKINANQNHKEMIIEKSSSLETLSHQSSDIKLKLNKSITLEKVKASINELLSDISQCYEISSIVPYVIRNCSQCNMITIIDKSVTIYIKLLLLKKCLKMQAVNINYEAEANKTIIEFINENNALGLIFSSSLDSSQ